MSETPVGDHPRVAVVQSAAVLGDVGANLETALSHIESLSGRAELVVFPELFTTGYSLTHLDHDELAEVVPTGESLQRLTRAAATNRVAVCCGVLERDGDALFDTVVVFDSQGRLAGRYRKTHLHPSERATFKQGDELVVLAIGHGIRLGVAICFEHAFPEIFAELALGGANVIAIPSAVPEGFGYLMELRTRARAQDNQVFVAAANLAGDDGDTRWCGRSAIVDPRGELLAFAGTNEDAQLIATLDLAMVEAERHQEPVFHHRRPELYRRLRSTVEDPSEGGS
jgi:predicted amidohydrolase